MSRISSADSGWLVETVEIEELNKMRASQKHRNGERGQVLILCAVFLVVLLLFVGLAIDFGLAYITKANLGKSVDAAALTAARYSAQGEDQSTLLAKSAFAMNYGNPARDHNNTPPVPTITYTPDPSGTYANVSATATIDTFFIGMLPQYKTLNVSSVAQSKAALIEMTLVLDRSGSMSSDGGSANLAGAVTDFIDYFDNTKDSVALVTFSATPTTVLPMTTGNFQQQVINDANAISYGGSTFSDAALQQALTQEYTVVTGSPLKVVVFFTDGGANMIQNALTCGPGSQKASGTWSLGGQDPPSTDVGFLDPTTGNESGCYLSSKTPCCTNPANPGTPATFPSSSQGQTVAPAWTSKGPVTTPWTTGTLVPISYTNVQADALYRPIGDAIAMRKAGITVYAIGLGSAPAPADPTFLCQVANDPSCSPTYDSTLPAGVMQYAATGADLGPAFQAIASIIRLRLTQ
jgi:Flp pilus assembly protein TadG